MSFVKEQREAVHCNRIKNLSKVALEGFAMIYENFIDVFEPRCFTFFHLIARKIRFISAQIAGELNQTHQSVVQMATSLQKCNLTIAKIYISR